MKRGFDIELTDRSRPLWPCQACGARMRADQRVCIDCGRLAVQLVPASEGRGYGLVLEALVDDASAYACLAETLQGLGWDAHVSDSARPHQPSSLVQAELPKLLVDGLCEDDAEDLAARLHAGNVAVSIRLPDGSRRAPRVARKLALLLDSRYRWVLPAGLACFGLVFLIAAAGETAVGSMLLAMVAGLCAIAAALRTFRKHRLVPTEPLLRLRPAPAALPASDPLVLRITSLLPGGHTDDVRDQLAAMASLVQRVVDHRASLLDEADRAELDLLTEPVAPLVDQVVRLANELKELDAHLRACDETTVLRGLDRARARQQPAHEREALVALDRHRDLQDERARIFGRLLDARHLLQRATAGC